MTTPHDKAVDAVLASECDRHGISYYECIEKEDVEAIVSRYLSSIGGVVCAREPVAWGRVIGGEAITVSRTKTGANCDPLHTPIEAGNGGDGWLPIETMPTDRQFLAFGYYFYPGDKAPTVYTMIAEASFGDPEWPYRTNEGTHRKGFFSHWCDLPKLPVITSNEGREKA